MSLFELFRRMYIDRDFKREISYAVTFSGD